MADRPPLSRAEVLDRAVFALELAARTTTPDATLTTIRNALHDLDARDLRRVVACLALQAVLARPAAEVAAWIERLQLEHLMILEKPDE
jgi:predicted alpha/beta-hydrolase family hydrolase